MNYCRLFTVAILAVSSAAVHAAGPSTKPGRLPADGAWVRYFVVTKLESGNERSELLTISLVGTQKESGQTARWIELKLEARRDGQTVRTDVYKMLIPEKALLEEANPVRRMIRIWVNDDDGRIDDLSAFRDLNGKLDFSFGPKLVFLPGPLSKAKVLQKKKAVDYQKGRLEASKAFAGRHVAGYQPVTVPNYISYVTKYTYWRHRKVPFGFIAAEMKTTHFWDKKPTNSRTIEYTLDAFGSGAETSLPDHN